jgi:hypothetical protein
MTKTHELNQDITIGVAPIFNLVACIGASKHID